MLTARTRRRDVRVRPSSGCSARTRRPTSGRRSGSWTRPSSMDPRGRSSSVSRRCAPISSPRRRRPMPRAGCSSRASPRPPRNGSAERRGVVIDGRHHAALVGLGEAAGLPFPEVGPVEPAAVAPIVRGASMSEDRVDLAIVGGGILGLATAYRLLERHPDMRLAILEKEAELATHQSGHNSAASSTPACTTRRARSRRGCAARARPRWRRSRPSTTSRSSAAASSSSPSTRPSSSASRVCASGPRRTASRARGRRPGAHARDRAARGRDQGALEPDDRDHRLPAGRARDRRRGPSRAAAPSTPSRARDRHHRAWLASRSSRRRAATSSRATSSPAPVSRPIGSRR